MTRWAVRGSGAEAGAAAAAVVVTGAAVAVAAVVVAVVDMVSVIPDCFFGVSSMLCSCLGRTVRMGLTGMGSAKWG